MVSFVIDIRVFAFSQFRSETKTIFAEENRRILRTSDRKQLKAKGLLFDGRRISSFVSIILDVHLNIMIDSVTRLRINIIILNTRSNPMN